MASFANTVHARKAEKSFPCPCCGHLTLFGRGQDEICPVCFWHHDGQDVHDADAVRGGPNDTLSLTQARKNFREFGACARNLVKHVRGPLAEETHMPSISRQALDRYFDRRSRGDQEVTDLLELHPFTCVTGFALGMAIVASSVLLAVFTDSRAEFWRNLWISASGTSLLAAAFLIFFRRERISPISLRARRLLWWTVLWSYVVLGIWLMGGLFQPYAKSHLIRAIISLGTALPLPLAAWQLLQKTRANQANSPLKHR